MKRTVLTPLALVATVILAATVFSQSPQLPAGPARSNVSMAPHPNINRAINALQNAKADLEDAAHDYCGHRADALGAVNNSLDHLHRAIACENAHGASTGDLDVSATMAEPVSAGAPHPLINRAINALQNAKVDLEVAAHDYCGHRAEALESVNHALEQLHRAIECAR